MLVLWLSESGEKEGKKLLPSASLVENKIFQQAHNKIILG